MDFFATSPQFNTLSILDLLRARDQFHAHLLHKANVVGTAVGRYLIRKADPFPTRHTSGRQKIKKVNKPPRTLENSEVREYSWPCILVFVSKWADENDFGAHSDLDASNFIPKAIYLEDGRSIPLCVVAAPLVEEAPAPPTIESLTFPKTQLAGGYPVIIKTQGVEHVASIGCLITDGHTIYVLTSRHVAGRVGEKLSTKFGNQSEVIGHTTDKQLGRLPFEEVYPSWPGKHIFVNMDVALVEVQDLNRWSPSVFNVGKLGPLADLSVENLTLNLISCPVKAHGSVSGRLSGRIAALFYRYKSVGGFEYVADFLIGSRDDQPLLTLPGDSGTVWVVEGDSTETDLMPIAVQWGGTVFTSATAHIPFALATNLSTVCRELEVDLYRDSTIASFEYWGAVGHYTIGAFACGKSSIPELQTLLTANEDRISFKIGSLNKNVNKVQVPGFIPLADVPDKVWKKTNSRNTPYGRHGPENPNHYADIDLTNPHGDSLDTLTPSIKSLDPATWRAYYVSMGWKVASSQGGLLPFRVWQIYKAMVDYVRQGQVEQFVAASGVLAHYVGDACQPLHGSYLDDGDPFRNPDGSPSSTMLKHSTGYANGVHGAYEDDMLDAKYPDILQKLSLTAGHPHGMALIQGGRQAGFAVIELMRRSQRNLHPIDIVNAFGALVSAGKKSVAPEVLWQKFGTKTIEVIDDGCKTLAMLWDSAWTEGHGNQIPHQRLIAIPPDTLKTIYEAQDFLPSFFLDKIDAHL